MFTALRDVMIECPKCKGETFIDVTQNSCKCINCGQDIARLPVLKVKRYNVVMAPKKNVYACHTVHDSDNFKEITGEVITSVNNPSLLGLKNGSDKTWTAVLPNGTSKQYTKDQVIKLGRGLKINFGNGNEGEII